MSLVAVLRGDSEDVDLRPLAEIENHAQEEERDDILRMLRRDECSALFEALYTSNPCLHSYIVGLIERIERKEHRS